MRLEVSIAGEMQEVASVRDLSEYFPKVGSFSAQVDGAPMVAPAILFGQFAVHSSFGFARAGSKGQITKTSGQISVSHCPTGMALDTFCDLMSAVYLAQELQRLVPADVANNADPEAIRRSLGKYFRLATLAAIGRGLGGSHD